MFLWQLTQCADRGGYRASDKGVHCLPIDVPQKKTLGLYGLKIAFHFGVIRYM